MKKHLILLILSCSLVASVVAATADSSATTTSGDTKTKKAQTATLTKNAKGEVRLRGCFRDANKDGVCDNSVKAGGKCKNNCVEVKPDKDKDKAKKAGKTTTSLCEGCPFLATCAGTCRLVAVK